MNPTIFVLPVLLAGLLLAPRHLPGALVMCSLFGATAAIEVTALGGAPVTPAALLLPLVALRTLVDRGADPMLAPLAPPQPGFWLLLLVLWGVAGSWFMPRVFGGDTLVYIADRFGHAPAVRLIPLAPGAGNISQSAYAVAALLTFASVVALLQIPGARRALRDAVLWVAGANVVAALLNLLELHTALPSLLEPLRNAGYVLLVGGEISGFTRISGTFAEPSVFAAFTLPILAFTATLWRSGVRRGASGVLTLATGVLVLLSTSSTAYVTLAVYVMVVVLVAAWRALIGGQPTTLSIGALALWAGAVAACLLVLLWPEVIARANDLISATVLRKMDTSSGIERSQWNAQAWQNFLDLHGIGAGLGSVRASSFVFVLLSNVGVLGVLLFGAFVVRLLFAAPAGTGSGLDDDGIGLRRAGRHAFFVTLLAAGVSGAAFDLGAGAYVFAAAAAAAATPVVLPARSPVRREARRAAA